MSFEQVCTSREEITFDGVDIKKDLSNNNAGVEKHNWTKKCLNLVATQEFHKSLTSSAYKTPKNLNYYYNYDTAATAIGWPRC